MREEPEGGEDEHEPGAEARRAHEKEEDPDRDGRDEEGEDKADERGGQHGRRT